jgi:hypothetical protein
LYQLYIEHQRQQHIKFQFETSEQTATNWQQINKSKSNKSTKQTATSTATKSNINYTLKNIDNNDNTNSTSNITGYNTSLFCT